MMIVLKPSSKDSARHGWQPVRRHSVARALGAISTAAVAVLLSGCSQVTGSTPQSQVRVVDAATYAGGIDVYQGSSALAYNLGLGTITSYVPLTPGGYTISVTQAGTKTQLVSASNTFAQSAQYTVLVGTYLTGLSEVVLRDQSTPAPSGQVAVRVVDQASVAGAVDLYLVPSGSTVVAVKPFLSNVTFGSNSGYLNLPSATYTLVVLPAGTTPTATGTTSYTGSAVVYGAGSAKTVFLLDQQLLTTPGVQVITARDFDPATSTSG